MTVNPAYTSVIGLVKYVRQYGLASDVAAAIAIARRGMRLTEKLPSAITAYLDVESGKHVWHWWSKINNLIKKSSDISSRHSYYSITVSNWESLVKPPVEVTKAGSKRKRSVIISLEPHRRVPPTDISRFYLGFSRFV